MESKMNPYAVVEALRTIVQESLNFIQMYWQHIIDAFYGIFHG